MAKRDLEAAKRFFRKMLQDQPLLSPDRIGTVGDLGEVPPSGGKPNGHRAAAHL
jgi:hypothetical protein